MARQGLGGTIAAALAALLVLLALAPPAAAETSKLTGRTEQGQKVSLVLERAKPKRFSIAYSADCRYGKIDRQTLRFRAPFDRNSRAGFRDKRTLTTHRKKGYYDKAKFRYLIEGRRSKNGFRGSFSLNAVYFHNGKKKNACRAAAIGWSARR